MLQNSHRDQGMCADFIELFIGQFPRLGQNRLWNRHLTDVIKQRRYS